MMENGRDLERKMNGELAASNLLAGGEGRLKQNI
jgi:hypothetical protein